MKGCGVNKEGELFFGEGTKEPKKILPIEDYDSTFATIDHAEFGSGATLDNTANKKAVKHIATEMSKTFCFHVTGFRKFIMAVDIPVATAQPSNSGVVVAMPCPSLSAKCCGGVGANRHRLIWEFDCS